MKKIFAANWKMNKTPQEAFDFCEKLKSQGQSQLISNNCEVMIFPQNFSLQRVSESLKDTPFVFGPQEIHFERSGAFTGENSADIAQAMGAKVILLGHSERRQLFGENSISLNKKLRLVQSLKMTPVFCIGETLDQRKAGKTAEVCFEQIQSVIQLGVDLQSQIDLEPRFILAYEPVWAIGTGQVATLEQVEETHEHLFKFMTQSGFKNFSILYGGSVKSDNAKSLIQVPHVDGFLIGGASLQVDSFLKICEAH